MGPALATENRVRNPKERRRPGGSHGGRDPLFGLVGVGKGVSEGSAQGLGCPRAEREEGREEIKEQSCSLGQISCCFMSDSQSSVRVGLEPGYASKSVGERECAREKREIKGEWASPAARGLHFAVIICTNSS